MRVVLDTNVVVSGALTPGGVCSQILDLMIEGVFGLCADDRILAEYESVLQRPELDIDPADGQTILGWVRSEADRIVPLPLPARLPDPDDLAFLEVAAAAEAILVTGNLRHFPTEACRGVTVVSPRDFLELLRHAA